MRVGASSYPQCLNTVGFVTRRTSGRVKFAPIIYKGFVLGEPAALWSNRPTADPNVGDSHVVAHTPQHACSRSGIPEKNKKSCHQVSEAAAFLCTVAERNCVSSRVALLSVCNHVLVGAVTQLQQQEDHGVVVCTSSSGLTLRRLSVWMCDPLVRLKTLAALVDVCCGNWHNLFILLVFVTILLPDVLFT